jgi:outer membrane protein
MKQLFITLLISAAVVLTGCGNGGAKQGANAMPDSLIQRSVSSQIAYVQVDTLMKYYNMYLDLSSQFEAKAKKAEADIQSRGRSLERSMADANEKFEKGLVTRAEAAQLQEDLQRKEQNFYQYRDNLQQELVEENQVMTNKILFSLHEYIKEFNSDYRYGMILTSTAGTPVLHADPSLDITNLVLRGLNEKYAKEHGKTKPASDSTKTAK